MDYLAAARLAERSAAAVKSYAGLVERYAVYGQKKPLFIVRIGMPPEEMINKCNKRKYFFDSNRRLIRSKRSRVPKGSRERSDTIRNALYSESDPDFIDFIEVS